MFMNRDIYDVYDLKSPASEFFKAFYVLFQALPVDALVVKLRKGNLTHFDEC